VGCCVVGMLVRMMNDSAFSYLSVLMKYERETGYTFSLFEAIINVS